MKDNVITSLKDLNLDELFSNLDKPSEEYKDAVISRLKLNIEANKNVSKLTKDQTIIENSLPFIKLYLDDIETCQNCGSRFIGLCPKKKGKGFCLRLVKEKDKLSIENTLCYKYLKVNEIVSKINIFYDDNLSFYIDGRKIIDYFNDLEEKESLKKKSEINKIINRVYENISHDNNKGYLLSSKKEGLSSRLLKAIALIFSQNDYKVSYIDSSKFFQSVFLEDRLSSSFNEYKLISDSDVLLLDNFDLVSKTSLSLYEDYLGKLLLDRSENNLITYIATTRSYNSSYLSKKYFNDSSRIKDYKNSFDLLTDLITIYDQI